MLGTKHGGPLQKQYVKETVSLSMNYPKPKVCHYSPLTTHSDLITLGVVAHAYNPCVGKDETGTSQVQGQCRLHSKTLSQNQKRVVTSPDGGGTHF